MITVMIVFEIILLILYIASTAVYIRDFIKPDISMKVAPRHLAWMTFILHFIYLLVLTLLYQRVPVANFTEFLSALAFGLIAIYIYLEFRFRTTAMGAWVIGLAAVIKAVSVFMSSHPIAEELHSILSTVWFPFHLLFGVIANASILMSAIFSLMYILMYRSLKRKSHDKYVQRFLPLATLCEMNFQTLVLGVIAFTLLMPFGFIMVLEFYGEFQWDFKYCMFFTSYLLYVAVVMFGLIAKWRGNRLAIFSLVALFVLILTISGALTRSAWHSW